MSVDPRARRLADTGRRRRRTRRRMLRFIRLLGGWQVDPWQWWLLDAARVQEAECRLELLGGKRAVEQARLLARTSTMTATQAIEHVRRNLANGYYQQHDERPVSGAGMGERG